MSGVVRSTGDNTRLLRDVDEGVSHERRAQLSTDQLKKSERRRFLSLRQLNCLAVIIVLSASGLVYSSDAAFVLSSIAYVYFLSKFAFPRTSSAAEPPVFGERNRLLGIYVSVGALLGLVLPAAYMISGIVSDDKQGAQAAAPHFFLLASQVFMEGVTFSSGFSLPVRAFVPVLYNSKRMFALADWFRAEIYKPSDGGEAEWRLLLGRSLAVANIVFWGYNLFGFLIPVYLPKALKKHYEKCNSKKAQD